MMTYKTALLASALAVGLVGATGCDQQTGLDEGESFIEGVFPLVGPACTVTAQINTPTFASTALLDIGENAGVANDLVLPVQVRTNLPSTFSTQTLSNDSTRSPNFPSYGNTDENVITFNQSEVFFSTDDDRGAQLQLGRVAGTPVNRGNERLTSVAGVVFNQQTQLLTPGIVFVTAITKGDAALLQAEPFVAGAISASGFAHIVVNIRLSGNTTGSSHIETPVFPFPIDLCAACLTTPPTCFDDNGTPQTTDDIPVAPIVNDKVCVQGDNFPSLVCP